MEVVVLIIHLLVCLCLIGLVLLQRSEGGALGMGGGGGSALMSGRGAADALAKMTSVAGGFFLVTSLSLTVLSGASASSEGRSVFDLIPQNTAPATPAPATEPAAPPESERPDPTEGSIAPDTQLASALVPGPAEAVAAPPPNAASERAAPLSASTPAAVNPQRPAATQQAAATSTQQQQPAATPSQQQRTAAATTQPGNARTTPVNTNNRLVLPNTSGAVTGITLEDTQTEPESVEVGNGVEAVRRQQRAGPDQ